MAANQKTYDVGNVAHITGTFTDQTVDPPVPVDPTNLSLELDRPDGTHDSLTPTRASLGNWYAEVPLPLPGTYVWAWVGTGARPVRVEGEFDVRPSLLDGPHDEWDPPTAGEVLEDSHLDFTALGYDAGALDPIVRAAVDWVAWATGRRIDSSLPVADRPAAELAVRMRVEQFVMRTSASAIQAATSDGVASISVGGASISFRDSRAASAGKPGLTGFPTAWDALNELLIQLMTPERLDEWRYLQAGSFAPDFAVTEISDWQSEVMMGDDLVGDWYPWANSDWTEIP